MTGALWHLWWRFVATGNQIASCEQRQVDRNCKGKEIFDSPPNVEYEVDRIAKVRPARLPGNRYMFATTAIILLFIISAVVVVSALLTWHFSLKTTTVAFDRMSETLREDVMESAAHKVKDFLGALSLDSFSVFKCLETLMPDFSRATMATLVLRCLWHATAVDASIYSAYVLTADVLFSSYRRFGPESELLNASISVTIPGPVSDPSFLGWVYAADEATGEPILDGARARICIAGQCPASVGIHGSDRNGDLWAPPAPPPDRVPAWVAAKRLAHGESLLHASMGLVGNWQPTLFLVRPLRDPATNNLMAAWTITYQASTIIEYLQTLPIVTAMDGVAYVTIGPKLDLLSTTHGSLVAQLTSSDGIPPPYLPAMHSDDVVVSTSSRHMNATFGTLLFEQPCEAVVVIPGHGRHYVNSQPITQQGLSLTIFLAVPRGAFWGDVDASRDHSLGYTVVTVAAIFVAGLIGTLLATVIMSRMYRSAEQQNQRLHHKLELASSRQSSDFSQVDMGTASEKLHAMIGSLQGGRVLTAGQVAAMQALLASSDDMHKPQFLRSMQGTATRTRGIDRETGAWLASLADPGARLQQCKPTLQFTSSSGMPPKSLRTLQIMRTVNRGAAEEIMVAQGLIASSSPMSALRAGASGGASTGASSSAAPGLPGLEGTDEATRLRLEVLDHVLQALDCPVNGPKALHHPSSDPVQRQLSVSGLSSTAAHPRGPPTDGQRVSYQLGSVTLVRDDRRQSRDIEREWVARIVVRESAPSIDPSPSSPGPATRGHQALSRYQALSPDAAPFDPASGRLSISTIDSDVEAALLTDGRPSLMPDRSSSTSPQWRTEEEDVSFMTLTRLTSLSAGDAGCCAHRSDHLEAQAGGRDPSCAGILGGGLDVFGTNDSGDQLIGAGGAASMPVHASIVPGGAGENACKCAGGWDYAALVESLRALGTWELDTLKVSGASGGQPILFVGYAALHRAGLVQEFCLPRGELARFLMGLDRGMDPEALYHSAAHIADVAGCMHHLLAESGVSQHLRRVDQLAALCAALIHDYKHPGVSNSFIQKMGGELAMRYNDNSPLENFHLSEAFELLTADGNNFLQHLGRATYADIRHVMIEMVLATDLQRHFHVLDAFKTRLLTLQDKPWDRDSESDRLLLLRMAIKVADLG
eukprot:jgi/Mesvir1/12268/Mv00479-RA.3